MSESVCGMNTRQEQERSDLADKHADEQMQASWRESQDAQRQYEEQHPPITRDESIATGIVTLLILAWVVSLGFGGTP